MAENILDGLATALNNEIIEMMNDGQHSQHTWLTDVDSMPFWTDIVRPTLVAMFTSSDAMAEYTVVLYSPAQDVFEAYFFEKPHGAGDVLVKSYEIIPDNEYGRVWAFQYDDAYNCFLMTSDYDSIMDSFSEVLTLEMPLPDGPFQMYVRDPAGLAAMMED